MRLRLNAAFGLHPYLAIIIYLIWRAVCVKTNFSPKLDKAARRIVFEETNCFRGDESTRRLCQNEIFPRNSMRRGDESFSRRRIVFVATNEYMGDELFLRRRIVFAPTKLGLASHGDK